jgi:hypothetical protein
MSAAEKILGAIAAMIVMGVLVNIAVGHFHLSQTFAPAGTGVVIGMGVALGAFSLTPKRNKWN